MKKRLLYLFVLVALTGYNAKGQFVKNWEKSAGSSYSWFATSGANINSCAYNPVTNKLYVANRDNDIYIIDPVSQVQTGTLNKTGVGLSLAFHKVRVTSTGEIFAVSIRTSTSNGNSFVYYWANENTPPVLLGNPGTGVTLASERSGDAFGLSGSGDNVVLYLGGSGTSNVQVISKVSGVFTLSNTIAVTASTARSSLSPVTTGTSSDIWISGATSPKKKISSTGAELKVVLDDMLAGGEYTKPNTISKKFASIEYFEVGIKKFLAATGANDSPTVTGEGLAFHVYDITDINNISLIAQTKLTNTYNTNAGPTSDIAIHKVLNEDGSYKVTFFQLVNHNGLASYSLNFKADGTLPVSLSDFTTSIKNGRNTLIWKTHSESNNDKFEVQRSGDGQNFETIATVYSKAENGNSNAVLDYQYIDENPLSGINYYRLKQLDKDGSVNIHAVKSINNGLSAITVSPNPTKDIVFISNAAQVALDYQVTDIAGKVILSGKSANSKIGVSLKDLKPAIYLVKVFDSGQLTSTFKVIKQ